jgi:hypothetical protein
MSRNVQHMTYACRIGKNVYAHTSAAEIVRTTKGQ